MYVSQERRDAFEAAEWLRQRLKTTPVAPTPAAGRRDYRVYWTIDLDATDPVDAARQALAIQRDPDSSATVFTVEAGGETCLVDLHSLQEAGNSDPD